MSFQCQYTRSLSIATPDIQYEDGIDSPDLSNVDSAYVSTVQSSLIHAPSRSKSRERKTLPHRLTEFKLDDENDALQAAHVDAASENTSRKYVFGAEMATQTSIDYDELIATIETDQQPRTVEDILKMNNTTRINVFRTSDDNLARGIQKFRESNQRSYSERSRTSAEKTMSRPHTPSVILIEQRITRSPIHMEASLIMHPFDDTTPIESQTNSVDYDRIPYADDDIQLDTDDERIINAAIRRYQMLGKICYIDFVHNIRRKTHANWLRW